MPAKQWSIRTPKDANDIVRQINSILAEIATAFGAATGFDGSAPKVRADLDLDGHNIKNVGAISYFTGSPVKQRRDGYRRQQAQTLFDAADLPDVVDIADINANLLPALRTVLTTIAAHLVDMELALEKLNVFKLPPGQ